MGLVSTWLNGIGLSSAVSTFQAAGIVTPAALAELDVAHFEALGISDPDDRRKLFYLVQRIKMAVSKDKKGAEHSVEEQVDAVIAGTAEMQEEEEQDSTKTKRNKKSANKSSPERKKSQSSTLKTPARRSRRIASKEESTATDSDENNIIVRNPAKTSMTKDSRSESPINASQTQAAAPIKAVSSPQKANTAKRQLLSPKMRVEKRQEDEENNDSEEDKSSSPSPKTSRKTLSRRVASKTASEIFNVQQEEDVAEASLAPPLRNTSSNHTSGLKKPTLVSASSELKSQKASKLQNPGKSLRTGKPLSVIPSDEVAPMSPLANQVAVNPGHKTSNSVSQGQHERQSTAGSHGSKASSAPKLTDEENDDQGSSLSGSSWSSSCSRPSLGVAFVAKTASHRRSTAPSDLATTNNNSSRRRSVDVVSKSSTRTLPFVQGGNQTESWCTQVEYLREDNNSEYELFRSEEPELYEFDMRIRVIVRKRPVSNAEASLSGGIDVIHPLEYGDFGKVLVYQPKTRVDLTKEIETIPFAFDNVYNEKSTNLEIYQRSLRSLIQPFFRGQWSTVFAYGQTGSGKTYTMMGSNMTGINSGTAKLDEKNLGLYYLAALDIFEMVKLPEYKHLFVQVSLFEIYGGKLFDLLNQRKQLKCLEDSKGKVCFPGLSEHPVCGPDDLMALIEEGATNRSTGTTSRNADSSRSHAVLQLRLRKDVGRNKNIEHGRLNFIDLAGSERGADTSSSSLATRLEGAEINTSLLALKEVIRALATGGSMTHIPFRGSKLTQVLKDSFVGQNSRCCMVACVSPDIGNCEQTLNTLRYADRVKERDAESGALADGYEQPTRLQRLDLSNAGQGGTGFDAEHEAHDDGSDGYEEDEDMELNQPNNESQALEDLMVPSLNEKVTKYDVQHTEAALSAKQQAGEALVAAHRSVMSKMLSMVKDEMILVNKVDADRDGLDDYLVSLETIQRTQLDLISKLRGSLSTYVTACENPSMGLVAAVASDEDSFEDLRD